MAAPSVNGPWLPMYKVRPYQCFDVVTVPDVMYKVKSYYANPHQGSAPGTTPLANLERRQEDVLKRLENLQASVSKLTQKYSTPVNENFSSTKSATTAASPTTSAPLATAASPTTSAPLATATSETTSAPLATATSVTKSSVTKTAGNTQCQVLPGSLLGDSNNARDLVICVDPDKIPLSLLVLSEELSSQHQVFKSTFVHSSVLGGVPDQLRNLLASNSGIQRGDCDLAVTLIWKKVAHGPHLVVDPTKQTTIQGEANVARYLSRLLTPSCDEDIVAVTQVDELLDLAQLQLVEGNSKERAAAVRILNSLLGKKDWLAGSSPGLADFVCWSAIHQAGQASNAPANVKKWLNLCGQHKKFQLVSSLI
ncbi:hypothetical protein BsWGS_21021 [Bradybaena similaris]